MDDGSAGDLACMLSVRELLHGEWRPEDLADLLRHSLDTPLGEYLSVGKTGRTAELEPGSKAPAMTLCELFRDPAPPLKYLLATKRHARGLAAPGASEVPIDVHHIIYSASIAVALLRHEERISKSGREVLQMAWQRLATEPYIDEWLRNIFADAYRAMTRRPRLPR